MSVSAARYPLDSGLHLQLGASLYIPAIHPDLLAVAKGLRYPQLKSLVIDLEDSLAESEWEDGYKNIRRLLPALVPHDPRPRPLLFVRVRHLACFQRLLTLPGIEQLNGFVWPKFTTHNMRDYLALCPVGFYAMPILEQDIFDVTQLLVMRDYLLQRQTQILSLRLGITDLLSAFNLRRNCFQSLYDIGIIQHLINQVVMIFKPAGFNISAPVYECIGEQYQSILREEVKLDLANGFFGKTVIHPWQIEVVQTQYQVSLAELEIASQLLNPHSPAVFKLHGQMHEKATHSRWARFIQGRAEIYGVQANANPATVSHLVL